MRKPEKRVGQAPSHGERKPKHEEVRRPARLDLDREGALRIWGTHAVEAALANERRVVRQLVVTEAAAQRFAAAAKVRGLTPTIAEGRDLDRTLGGDSVHQGVLALVEPVPEPTLDALIALAEKGHSIIVLDQVTDPHNVGAILRSAAVFGAAGVIMTRHHSPPLDGAVAKAASGALEQVPVALVANLARAMDDLGDAFVRRIGLDGSGSAAIDTEPFAGAVALVLGSEGKGLRRLTLEHCDVVCRIGSAGSLASLNVSNAAAVALYAAGRARRA